VWDFSSHCYGYLPNAVKNRRSLSPTLEPTGRDLHATRRGGARRETSARVTLVPSALCGVGYGSGPASAPPPSLPPLDGWALNVSRGGLRVILEQKVELGAEFDITIGDSAPATSVTPHHGRVVWVQEEPDGVIAGIEFRFEGQA
jgi:hypothetical protein